MSSNVELDKIAALAYLETDEQDRQNIKFHLNAIMELAEQLRTVDTTNITPLLHPLDLHQTLRSDVVEHHSQVPQLKKQVHLFNDDLYWVPKVINTGK